MMEYDKINRLPAHPGEVLKEELESRGISQKSFAQCLDVVCNSI